MRIHIFYKFADGPWGGGNQFLKSLRREFRKMNVYAENPQEADVLLLNNYPFGWDREFLRVLFHLKREKVNLITVHRIDGLMQIAREADFEVDRFIFFLNSRVCDGTIYQSDWSRKKCYELGAQKNIHENTIMNASDSEIFFPPKDKSPGVPTRLIATSWSTNPKKGFALYRFLDQNLDFSRYAMTFVGNSSIEFENIKHVSTVPSEELANILRAHDIYVTASRDDACSNSLIEALTCGLPAVALNSGGNPEIVGEGGVVFAGSSDILEKIDAVANNLKQFSARINCANIEKTSECYYGFCENIFKKSSSNQYKPKCYSIYHMLFLFGLVYRWRIAVRLRRLKR